MADENYQYILGLPIVDDLLKENKKLRRRNKELKRLVRLIGNNVSLLTSHKIKKEIIEIHEEDVIEIKKEKVKEIIEIHEEPNIVYEIVEELSVETESEEEEDDSSGGAEAPVEEEEEEAEAPAEEEEEEEAEAPTEEEEEAEEEDSSGGVRGAEAPAEEEVYEVTINGKSYYTTNETNGTIYGLDENGDVSLELGVYKAGKPTFV